MEAIGIEIQRLPVPNLRLVRDLEYYEGPLLSEFHSGTGGIYLFSWCDVDEHAHRWLVIRVNEDVLRQFLQRRLSLREVVLGAKDGFVFVVDIDGEQNYTRVALAQIHELPLSYVPKEQSFFDPTLMPVSSKSMDKATFDDQTRRRKDMPSRFPVFGPVEQVLQL